MKIDPFVQCGGIALACLRALASLTQLYTLTCMHVSSRFANSPKNI